MGPVVLDLRPAYSPQGEKMRTFAKGVGYSVHAALVGLVVPRGGGVTRARRLYALVCFLGLRRVGAPPSGPPGWPGKPGEHALGTDGLCVGQLGSTRMLCSAFQIFANCPVVVLSVYYIFALWVRVSLYHGVMQRLGSISNLKEPG